METPGPPAIESPELQPAVVTLERWPEHQVYAQGLLEETLPEHQVHAQGLPEETWPEHQVHAQGFPEYSTEMRRHPTDAVAVGHAAARARLERVFEEHDQHTRAEYRQGHGREPVAGHNIPLQERIDERRFHAKHGLPAHDKATMDDVALIFRLLICKILEHGYISRITPVTRGARDAIHFHRQHSAVFITSAPGPWLSLPSDTKERHLRSWLFKKFTLDKENQNMLPLNRNGVASSDHKRYRPRNVISWHGFWLADAEFDFLVHEIWYAYRLKRLERVFAEHYQHTRAKYRQGHVSHDKDTMDDVALIFRLFLDKVDEHGYTSRISEHSHGVKNAVKFHGKHSPNFIKSAPGPWLSLPQYMKENHLRNWLFKKFTLDKWNQNMLPLNRDGVALPSDHKRYRDRNDICWQGFWLTDAELDRLVYEIGHGYLLYQAGHYA